MPQTLKLVQGQLLKVWKAANTEALEAEKNMPGKAPDRSKIARFICQEFGHLSIPVTHADRGEEAMGKMALEVTNHHGFAKVFNADKRPLGDEETEKQRMKNTVSVITAVLLLVDPYIAQGKHVDPAAAPTVAVKANAQPVRHHYGGEQPSNNLMLGGVEKSDSSKTQGTRNTQVCICVGAMGVFCL